MDAYYIQTVNKKISIAKQLNNGEIGGSYFEAILIITSILSASASILWPGENIDRRRFVELLIKYNHTHNDFTFISIPLLNESHFLNEEQKGKIFKKYNLISRSQIFTGNDIDVSEHILLNNSPDIDVIKLRKYSYANIFYKNIRSAIVHEYRVSEFASAYPMSKRNAFVSYNNHLDPPVRRIYFNFKHIVDVTEEITREISKIIENAPLPKPKKWWLDG